MFIIWPTINVATVGVDTRELQFHTSRGKVTFKMFEIGGENRPENVDQVL